VAGTGLDVAVDGLSAGWPGGPLVLERLSFTVPAGGRLAVVGRSGVGKSTLAAVLLRFVEPSAGSVRIGGVDIRTLPGDSVRSLVGVCAQDAYVFDSTVAENVRLARPGASDEQVRDALAAAGLGDWLATLPDGLRTGVGEHGARLSGGQRQRLALARVLLADQPVVVFDEPTEHMDESGAIEAARELLARTAGRTVILLTHRPHGLADMDQVITLPFAG
jgi:ABC-type multidrug transport system fused ATPase/permease subunit